MEMLGAIYLSVTVVYRYTIFSDFGNFKGMVFQLIFKVAAKEPAPVLEKQLI